MASKAAKPRSARNNSQDEKENEDSPRQKRLKEENEEIDTAQRRSTRRRRSQVSAPPRSKTIIMNTIVMRAVESYRSRVDICGDQLDQHFTGRSYKRLKESLVMERKQKKYLKEMKEGLGFSEKDYEKMTGRIIKETKYVGDPALFPFCKDFVVGCEKPPTAWSKQKKNFRTKVLVKFAHFPDPKWMEYSKKKHGKAEDVELRSFELRQKLLDKVESFMRDECAQRGTDFDALYPSRYLKSPQKEETYSRSKHALLMGLLRAREAEINAICKAAGLPPLYIVDWTGEVYEDDSLFNFVFTNYLRYSDRVRKAMDKADNMTEERCSGNCSCTSGATSNGCTCKHKGAKNSRVECGELCKCDDDCPSRMIQRGRQVPLIVFRDRQKGWCIRSAVDLDKGVLVSEYVGEVLTYNENLKRDQTYAADLADSFVDVNRPSNLKETHRARKREKKFQEDGFIHRNLTINAGDYSNEGRWFSHSCGPNMELVVTYVERVRGFHRIGFVTGRPVAIGEELCWNYHGDDLVRVQRAGRKLLSALLQACCCGLPECAIKPVSEYSPADHEEMRQLRDEKQTDYDSFDEDEKEKEEVKKGRRDSRAVERAKRREEDSEESEA